MDRRTIANNNATSLPWLSPEQRHKKQQEQQQQQNLLSRLFMSQQRLQLRPQQYSQQLVAEPQRDPIGALQPPATTGIQHALLSAELQQLLALVGQDRQHHHSQLALLSDGAPARTASNFSTDTTERAKHLAFLSRWYAIRAASTIMDNQESILQPNPMQHHDAQQYQALRPFAQLVSPLDFQISLSHQHHPQNDTRSLEDHQSAQMQELFQHIMVQQLVRGQPESYHNMNSTSAILPEVDRSLPSLSLYQHEWTPQLHAHAARPEGFIPTASLPSCHLDSESNCSRRPHRNKNISAKPVSLVMSRDHLYLSPYQIFIRQQLELFSSDQRDCLTNQQGRRKRVKLGQVGIRCRHCSHLPLPDRGRGSCYYPQKLLGVYQAAQNIATTHLAESCPCLPENMRDELTALRHRKDTATGGKNYWANACLQLGLADADDGTIRFGTC